MAVQILGKQFYPNTWLSHPGRFWTVSGQDPLCDLTRTHDGAAQLCVALGISRSWQERDPLSVLVPPGYCYREKQHRCVLGELWALTYSSPKGTEGLVL